MTDQQKKRGKPGPKPRGPFANKRKTLTTRITERTRRRIEEAAEQTDRSLSQEIEFRLERSLSDEDLRHAEFGSEAIYKFMKTLVRVVNIVELKTGSTFGDDPFTRAQAILAMQYVLQAYEIEAGSATVDRGKSVLTGEPPVGKEVGESLGKEIGRELARLILGIDVDPLWHANLACDFQSALNTQLLLRFLTNRDRITSLELSRWNVNDLAINFDALVAH